MPVCTFFGHRNCDDAVKNKLRKVLEELIVQKGVKQFYVGTHGNFDLYVYQVLCELRKKFPEINFSVVLAYMPGKREIGDKFGWYQMTIYPNGVEKVPKRFAVSYRNRWMVEQADYVVTYIRRFVGGAAQFAELAKRKGKVCFNLAEL